MSEDPVEEKLRHIRGTLEIFGNHMKVERELWVCRGFLTCLDLTFNEEETVPSENQNDIVDVNFRTAKFQIKELLDPGRKRTQEYKERISKLEESQDLASTLIPVEFDDVDQHGIASISLQACQDLNEKKNYTPEARSLTDLLLYYNMNLLWPEFHTEETVDTLPFASLGWRSISITNGSRWGIVLSASEEAPSLLHGNVGRVQFAERHVSPLRGNG